MRTAKLFCFLLCMSPALLCVNCATILAGTDQEVTFTSQPSGARVDISCMKGKRFYNTTTPGTVKVCKRSSYLATYRLDGYHTATFPVERGMGRATAGSFAGNALLGGVVGLGVDTISGANANLPRNVHAEMIPETNPPPDNAGDYTIWIEKIEKEKAARKEEKKQKKKFTGR